MPQFGLRGATVAQYNNNDGAVTYGNPIGAGCAITVNLELTFAEARLYACDSLAEYLREVTGGNITFGAKLFPQEAQLLMFGSKTKTRSVKYTPEGGTQTTKTVTSVATTANDDPSYVGFGCYAPDMVNGVRKYTAFFVPKVKFSTPSTVLQTKGESITFQTPQTTGAFLQSDASDKVIQEIAICDDEEQAKAWITAAFGAST